MTGVFVPPRWSVVAEDLRNLERRSGHVRRLDGWMDIQVLQWPFDLAQALGCNLTVARCVLELFVTQKHLDDADILVVLEQMCGAGNEARRVCRSQRPPVPYETPG